MIRSILILFLTTFSLRAATHYVAKSGLDSNPGTIGSPWLTVQKASTTAVDGDAVLIQTGFYEENVTFSKTNVIFYGNGTNNVFIRRFHPQSVSKFCTISNLTLGTATLSGSHAYWDSGVSNKVVHCLVNQNLKQGLPGIRLSGSFGHILSNHVTGVTRECAVQLNSGSASNLVESNHFRDMDNVDIFRMWGRGNIIRDNDVYNILNTGYESIPYHGDFIQWFSIATNTVSTNHIVEFNRVRDSRIQLFHLNGANSGIPQSTNIGGTKIRYNVFSGLTHSGYMLSPGLQFYNNVVYRCATNTQQGPVIHVLNTQPGYGTGKDSRVYNNVFIGCGAGDAPTFGIVTSPASGSITDYNFYSTLSYGSKSHNEPHSLTAQNPQFADAVNLDFTILETSPLIQKGTTADATYTTDRAGNPQSSPWTIGNFVFVGDPGDPGSISLTFDSFTSPENSTLQIPVIRQVGTAGAVSVNYQTADLDAVSGVDYTGVAGTLNWASGNSDTNYVNITILNVSNTNRAFKLTLSAPGGGATLTSPTVATNVIIGSAAPLFPTLFAEAEAGQVSPPFIVNSTFIAQDSTTTDPALGGSARYRFTIPTTGEYVIDASVNAPNTMTDSLFFEWDGEPTSPDDIWDVSPLTASSFEPKRVNARGPTGTPTASDFVPKRWNLSAGEHTLYVRGREPTQLDNITVVFIPPPDTTPAVLVVGVTTPSALDYLKAGDTIPLLVTFNTNMTVVGTPSLLLNNGGTGLYTSGDGTDVLTFTYTVGAGEDNSRLDYLNTNSLVLNGGSIKHGAIDADLTLGAPGSASSLSAASTIIVDTIPPVVTIGNPSLPTMPTGIDIVFTVSVSDVNIGDVMITPATLNLFGTATATTQVEGNAISWVVRFSNTTAGTLFFSIDAGVATDLAGNTSLVSSPSSVISIERFSMTVIRAGTLRNVFIGTP